MTQNEINKTNLATYKDDSKTGLILEVDLGMILKNYMIYIMIFHYLLNKLKYLKICFQIIVNK